MLAGVSLLLPLFFHGLPPVGAQTPTSELIVPELRSHPLPASLAQWSDPQAQGDYFEQIQPTQVGYLIWSNFPIKVYIAPAIAVGSLTETLWRTSVVKAVAEWQPYLSLNLVEQPELADITIAPLKPQERSNSRIRSAEALFELYLDSQQKLAHRFQILIRPNQTPTYITAAVRHELGHALGIWGHSSLATDALYFSQVRNPPVVSRRDVNTLKRIYQQPTRLGWSVLPIPPSIPSPEKINQTDR